MVYIDGFEHKPNIFFTSDTHFSQERTLELSKRPFKNVEEMDNAIIDNWNSVVEPNDIVYHLGDFGNVEICKKLHGNIKLILGNYEFDIDKLQYFMYSYDNEINFTPLSYEPFTDDTYKNKLLFDEFKNKMIEFGFNNVLINNIDNLIKPIRFHSSEFSDLGVKCLGMAHLPSEIRKAVEDPNDPIDFGLFGHIHRSQMVRRYGINVGIDCNNYFPMSLKDVKFFINAIKNHYDNEVFE